MSWLAGTRRDNDFKKKNLIKILFKKADGFGSDHFHDKSEELQIPGLCPL